MARRRNPAWTLFLEDGRLVASAGADALFLLDEISPDDARALHAMWQTGSFDGEPNEAVRRALVELENAGAIVVARPVVAPLRWALCVVGATPEAADVVGSAFDGGAAEASIVQVAQPEADVVVLVRAGGSLLEASEAGAKLAAAHLFVDLAFAHTLSLGPLVFPGETACLTCFAGRIRFGWGDPPSPPEPTSLRRAPIAAAWIRDRLATFRETGTCATLVERCVAIDMDALTMRAERVFRLPWCTVCFPEERRGPAGSFALPWVDGQKA
jgi:hypothetical protein